MSVGIVTDSTAYLPAEWARAHGVEVVPLSVLIDRDVYVEGAPDVLGPDGGARPDAERPDLAKALAKAGTATTSRPSPQEFLSRYEALAAGGAREIVSIHLSAALSGTCEAALLAARAAPVPVRVVDSATMGAGLAYAVRDAVALAARAVQTGVAATADDLADTAGTTARSSSVLFCVASLEFLRRGGRIGAASALLGSALAVKPLLALREGRIEPIEKQRTMGRAVGRLVELAAEAVPAGDARRVTVHHVAAEERGRQIAEAVRARCGEGLGGPVDVVELGPVAATHLGPGSVGIVVAPPGS